MIRRTILVVEDDPGIREHIADVLSPQYEVATADDGSSALEMLRGTFLPSVVLLDLVMPLVTGWEVLAEMRASHVLRDVPVVVMSSSSSGAAGAESKGLRALTKPFGHEVLLDTVRLAADRVSLAPPPSDRPAAKARLAELTISHDGSTSLRERSRLAASISDTRSRLHRLELAESVRHRRAR